MTIEIVAGDCRTAISRAYDAMIVDPPYSQHVHKNATSFSAKRGVRHRDLGFEHLSGELRGYIATCAAGVKRWSVIYSDIEGYHDWRVACLDAGASYIRGVSWVRWSSPQLSGDRPPQGCELLSLFWGSQKGRKSWNGPGNLTHLAHKCLRGEGKHKAEKPLDQMLDLVSWFTNPGEWVLDPCAGSGTVGLACKLLGRNYTGYEIDNEWALKAAERIHAPLSARDQERVRRWKEAGNEFENGNQGGARGAEDGSRGGAEAPSDGGVGGEAREAVSAPPCDGEADV